MFKLMLNKCCPLYTPKIISNKIKNPWINNSLLKCIHHKKKLLKLFIVDKNDFNHIKYKKYRNILTSVLRNTEKLFYKKALSNCCNNSKKHGLF